MNVVISHRKILIKILKHRATQRNSTYNMEPGTFVFSAVWVCEWGTNYINVDNHVKIILLQNFIYFFFRKIDL